MPSDRLAHEVLVKQLGIEAERQRECDSRPSASAVAIVFGSGLIEEISFRERLRYHQITQLTELRFQFIS